VAAGRRRGKANNVPERARLRREGGITGDGAEAAIDDDRLEKPGAPSSRQLHR
jgi:hypothetical protein